MSQFFEVVIIQENGEHSIVGGIDISKNVSTLFEVRNIMNEEIMELLPSSFAFLRGGRIPVGQSQEAKLSYEKCTENDQLLIKSVADKSAMKLLPSSEEIHPPERNFKPPRKRKHGQSTLAHFWKDSASTPSEIPLFVNEAVGKVKLYAKEDIEGEQNFIEKERMKFFNKKANELCSDPNTKRSVINSSSKLRGAINSSWFIKKCSIQAEQFSEQLKKRREIESQNPVIAKQLKLASDRQVRRVEINMKKVEDSKVKMNMINEELGSKVRELKSCFNADRRKEIAAERKCKEEELSKVLQTFKRSSENVRKVITEIKKDNQSIILKGQLCTELSFNDKLSVSDDFSDVDVGTDSDSESAADETEENELSSTEIEQLAAEIIEH